MPLNIHPLVVHTPLGLLSLYALLECVPLRKVRALPYWFYVKAVLVIFGTGGSYAALFTGNLIADEFDSPLLEMHSLFAWITATIFSILAGAYLIQWIHNVYGEKIIGLSIAKYWNWLLVGARFILRPWVTAIIALAGLAALTITGSLGGALVYGPDIDPVVSTIYYWFFPKT